MDKDVQPDSMSAVTIKPDYPPSEVYSSEPPPAYHKSQSSAVQVAKIIAITLVLMSVVLGSFLLASAYVTANASCRQLEQELELLSEAADRFQGPLQPEALIQEDPRNAKTHADNLQQAETQKVANKIDDNSIDSDDSESSVADSSDSSNDSSESESKEKSTFNFKLPLQLNFDDLAGALIEKNQKSRMNCIVEKKRAEQVVDHQPKTINLPFGLNLTTDPKYEHLTGERMAIFCESGNVEKEEPQDDSEEEGIMIQPVMIPIPQSHFPTHMAQQAQPIMQMQQLHPMETMRPPMPPMVQQEEQNQFPPNKVLRHIAQEIIAQNIMEAHQRQQQMKEDNQRHAQQNTRPDGEVAQEIPIPPEILSHLSRLPNQNIVVSVTRQIPQEMSITPEMHIIPQEMRSFPQEIRQIPQALEEKPQVKVRDENQEMSEMQQQQERLQVANNRQAYSRLLPLRIPVQMIQSQQEESRGPEEIRPHYVQPRSVRSVDALLSKPQKRVKRCSCDCAC